MIIGARGCHQNLVPLNFLSIRAKPNFLMAPFSQGYYIEGAGPRKEKIWWTQGCGHQSLGDFLSVFTKRNKVFTSPNLVKLSCLFFKRIFVWLCWVLVVVCEIFSCGMWDLVPWPGIEPRPPALGAWSLRYCTSVLKSLTLHFMISLLIYKNKL